MRILIFLISLAIIPLYSGAQSFSLESADHTCGTDGHHARLMETDPAYRSNFLSHKAVLDSIKRAPATIARQLPMSITIPIVVHVVHLGERVGYNSNISDQQIYDAITGLNERYANVNGQGQDIEINFCLANRDPNGCPTSGIMRVDGSMIPDYREEGITWDEDCGADEIAIKDLSKWPTWEYYNVWVVHDICGNIAGYAYYPNGDEYDGTVIDIASMRYENGTLAHELGHGLNLKHTFSGTEEGDCPLNDDCLEDGDEVCDTPPHRTNDCGINNPCSSEGEWLNSRNNWMSYCFPSADAGLFTEDQRTRMLDAMSVEPRLSLVTSQGCANEVSMQITSDGSILCPYENRNLTAQPDGGFFEIISGSGYIHENILTATGGSQIVIAYTINQDSCISSVYQEILVKPVPQSLLRSDEDSLCSGQSTTLQGFPTGGIYSLVSGPGILDSNVLTANGSGAIELAYEKLFSGCIIRDSHVVMSFDLTEVEIEALTADVLTAVPDTGIFQWLRCDQDYEIIPDATHPVLVVPSSGSYAVVMANGACIDTSDCIEIALTSTDPVHIDDISIYPNPVQDIFYLVGYAEKDKAEITLTDIRGVRMIPEIRQGERRLEINISSFPSGVYVIHLNIKGVRQSVKRVVKV